MKLLLCEVLDAVFMVTWSSVNQTYLDHEEEERPISLIYRK